MSSQIQMESPYRQNEDNLNGMSYLDDENIFKPYRASPLLKSKEKPKKNANQSIRINNHELKNEEIDPHGFSFSNSNDESLNKKSRNQSQNDSPYYNANVKTKKDFFQPETREKGFTDLENREITDKKEKIKKKSSRVGHQLKTLYAQKMKDHSEDSNRWNYLYELSKAQREALNVIREEKKKEIDNDPNLTFHPKISNNSKMSTGFLQRVQIWSDQKKEKIETKKRNECDKDLEHCTFHPTITPSYNSKIVISDSNQNKLFVENKGVEQFLRRQILARQAKEEKELLMTNLFFIQKKDAGKDQKIVTLPNEFHLGNTNLRCPSVKKEFNRALSPSKINSNIKYHNNNYEDNQTSDRIKEIFYNPNDIHLQKITFGQAIKELHGELHNMDINID